MLNQSFIRLSFIFSQFHRFHKHHPLLEPLHNLPTFLVKYPKFWYNLGFPNPPKGNLVRHILILFSIFLLSSPLFGQSERPETIIIPVSGIGDVSNTRKLILGNTLIESLSQYFRLVPQDKFEEVQEKVFEEYSGPHKWDNVLRCIFNQMEIKMIYKTNIILPL